MKLRRLRILGIALALSLLASFAGIAAYLAPRASAPNVNRIADYVALNNAYFFVRSHPVVDKLVHFPDWDQPNDRLNLVEIDEASLNEPKNGGLGQWPWPRKLQGDILTRLGRAGAKVVTYDVLFAEADQTGGDARFAQGMRAQPTVLPFAMTTTKGSGVLGLSLPPPQLADAARALGFTTVDNPGGWLVGQFFTVTATPPGGAPRVYRSLAAATLERYTGLSIRVVSPWEARLGDRVIPLDGEGQFTMLPFNIAEHVDQQSDNGLLTRAGAAALSVPFVQTVSFADLAKFDDATMKAFAHGNIIVIGPTAQGLGDFIVTPNGRYPGVFANLRLMDQIIAGKFIRRVPPALDIALILLLPLVIGVLVTQLRPSLGIAIAIVVALLYSATAIGLYGYSLRWLDLVHVNASIIVAALFVALYRVVTEGADKRVIREMFGKHVSPALVDEMLSHDDPLKALGLSGKRAKVTIFYSDIRGFTAMSEKMTAEQIYGQLNEYFEEMCKIVFEHDGYVDKFIGDCLMAVFSLNERPIDAYEAVESAIRQQEKILEMMAEWGAQGRQIFTVGMGLNTGEVVMGNLGSSNRLNYTVIGDNVNTAARLYNVAKGGQTIISESTYNEVKDRFIVNELTPVYVKGKQLPLRNFEVLGRLRPGEPNPSTLLDPENMPQATVAADH